MGCFREALSARKEKEKRKKVEEHIADREDAAEEIPLTANEPRDLAAIREVIGSKECQGETEVRSDGRSLIVRK